MARFNSCVLRDQLGTAQNKMFHSPGGDPQIRQQLHDIRIINQIIYLVLHPPIEDCRYNVLQQLFAWQAVVTSQNRIQSTR